MSCRRAFLLRPLSHFNHHQSYHLLRRPHNLLAARHFQAKPTVSQPPLSSTSLSTLPPPPPPLGAMTSIALPHNVDPSPLFVPPHMVTHPEAVTRLAVYGTLRDDDNSGASWTSSFIANRTSAVSGIVRGAKLYWAHKLNYPAALVTNNTNDHIHVRVLAFGGGEAWTNKLAEADRIEGYDPEVEGRGEYVRRRVVVEIGCEGSELTVEAWIYVATKLDHFGQVVELPHGDWTRRAETDQWKKNDDTQ